MQRFLTCFKPVQGRLIPEVLRESSDCVISGRGLLTTRDVVSGELVCVYFGEVVPYAEACVREAQQRSNFGCTYVLIMRTYIGDSLFSETCIDGDAPLPPSNLKCAASLINHSCDPNLTIVPVYVDNMIPYAALFANKSIACGTEVTYNYSDCVPARNVQLSTVPCLCGAENCAGFLPNVE
ncbi:unnamed protein product [Calicophoron daubneyi]